jgi:hypothetical protein
VKYWKITVFSARATPEKSQKGKSEITGPQHSGKISDFHNGARIPSPKVKSRATNRKLPYRTKCLTVCEQRILKPNPPRREGSKTQKRPKPMFSRVHEITNVHSVYPLAPQLTTSPPSPFRSRTLCPHPRAHTHTDPPCTFPSLKTEPRLRSGIRDVPPTLRAQGNVLSPGTLISRADFPPGTEGKNFVFAKSGV